MSSEDLNSYEPSIESKENEPSGHAIDALVVFGFGIKSDADLEKAGMLSEKIPKTARQRLPLGAKLRTAAAAELYFDGQVGDVIFTGGPVNAKEGVTESKAELMEDYFLKILAKRERAEIYQRLREKGQDPQHRQEEIERQIADYLERARKNLLREDRATNTIENFSNTINLLHWERSKYQSVGLLSSQFHLDRIAKLARKHNVEGIPVSADQTMLDKREKHRKIINHYFAKKGNQHFRNDVLSDFDLPGSEERNDIEAKFGPRYGQNIDRERSKTDTRLGTSFDDYQKGEKRWSRGLDEIPEYWMQGLQFMEDEDQLRAILTAEQELSKVLQEKLGKSVDEATQKEIQTALSSIDRIMPPAEWGEKEKNV